MNNKNLKPLFFLKINIKSSSNIKHLIFFHHEPNYDDKKVYSMYESSMKYKKIVPNSKDLKISLAYEGMQIEV